MSAGILRVQRLLQGSATYMAVGLVQRAIGFLLLPFYARALSPSDYGVVAILLTIVGVFHLLLSFGLETAVFRAYFVYKDDKRLRDRYVNTMGCFLLVVPIVIALGCVSLALLTNRLHVVSPGFLSIELAAAAIYVSASAMPLAYVRAKEDLRAYVRINASYAVSLVFLKSAFILGFGWGIKGWVLSDLFSAIIMLMVALRFCGHHWTREFDRSLLRNGLRLGLPLLPHLMSHWVLALSDRLVLGALLPTKEVGIYSMGYQVGIILGIALTETNRAILPSYGRAISDRSARILLGQIASMQILFTAILGALAILLGPSILGLILPVSYAPAGAIIPGVALGYIFFGWYYVPMNTVSILAGDTRFVAIPTVLSAMVNTSLNLLFVSQFGIKAAAINTAISYGVLLVLISAYYHFRVDIRPSLVWPMILEGIGALLVSGLVIERLVPSDGFLALSMRGLAILPAIAWSVVRMTRAWNMASGRE